MAFSSIVKKKCKCSPDCDKWPSVSWGGFFYAHAPQELKTKMGEKSRKSYQNKLSRAKKSNLTRKVHEAAKDIRNELSKPVEAGNNAHGHKLTSLDMWFMQRRLEMENCCGNCGKGTNRNNVKYYRWSIAHIVPKSLVKSVATNPNNWFELCQLCHAEYDNTFDRAAAMQCFGEIKMKFQLFKDLIPAHELRKVNPHLLS